MWEGVFSGVALAAANGIAAWVTIRVSWGQSSDFFIKAFLGGMMLRLFSVGLIAVLLFKFTAISKGSFTAAFCVTFVIFQVAEIIMIVRRRTAEQQGGSSESASEADGNTDEVTGG